MRFCRASHIESEWVGRVVRSVHSLCVTAVSGWTKRPAHVTKNFKFLNSLTYYDDSWLSVCSQCVDAHRVFLSLWKHNRCAMYRRGLPTQRGIERDRTRRAGAYTEEEPLLRSKPKAFAVVPLTSLLVHFVEG